MAASKNRYPKSKKTPEGENIISGGNPLSFMSESPAWRFTDCDKRMWCALPSTLNSNVNAEIFSFMQNIETMTWGDILSQSNNKHHFIPPYELNKIAQDRLNELHVEAEAIMSFRISATHRLYGHIVRNIFHILWFDNNHGDNDTCVCRSHKKHT